MIAKLVVHGDTRAVALGQMERALRRTDVGGTTTNISFLSALCAQPDFAAGRVDTGLIDRNLEQLAPAPVACSKARSLAALTALGLGQGTGADGGFVMWTPLTRSVTLVHLDERFEARVSVSGPDVFEVSLEGAEHTVARRGGLWWVDDTKVLARLHVDGGEVSVFWGNGYRFTVPDPLDRVSEAEGGGNLIVAPMPGLVKSLFARTGQNVARGDRLAVLEAMKMEHALLAARDGVVAEILSEEGAQVEEGAALIRLEDEVE